MPALAVAEDDAASAPVSPTERLSTVDSIAPRSRVELTAWPTSESAFNSSTERHSSSVRDRSSVSNRAFSIAMTA